MNIWIYRLELLLLLLFDDVRTRSRFEKKHAKITARNAMSKTKRNENEC